MSWGFQEFIYKDHLFSASLTLESMLKGGKMCKVRAESMRPAMELG